MKNLLAALVLLGAGKGAELRGIVLRRLGDEDENFSFTGTLGLSGGAGPFVKVQSDNPKRWQKLIIDDIPDYGGDDIPGTYAWTMKGDSLLHSGLDENMCIQAGYGGTVKHGTKLRLNKCDESNEFQRWNSDIHGSMKLLDDKFNEYCVASSGASFDLGKDPMIMVDCDRLDEECGRGCFSFD